MKMARNSLWLAALVTVLWQCAATAADEQWLTYKAVPDRQSDPYRIFEATCETTSTAPPGVKLPAFAGTAQLYAKWPTPLAKAGHVWVVLDRTGSAAYDAAYVDSDADGDLTSETPVKPWLLSGSIVFFNAAKVVFPSEEGPVTYHVYVHYSSGESDFVGVASGGRYEGRVKAGGREYGIELVDYNSNGVFNDTSDDFMNADHVVVKDSDKTVLTSVGRYIQLGGALYHPEVSPDGAYIKLTDAADAPFGTIRVPGSITSVAVGGRNGLLRYEPAAGICRVPAGTYRVFEWQIERSRGDKKWKAVSRPLFQQRPLAVSEGKETALDIGEPLQATIHVGGKDASGQILLAETLSGKTGEFVMIYQGDEYAPAPKMRIRNADGSYDRVFQTRYG